MKSICAVSALRALERFGLDGWPSTEEVLLAVDEARAILEQCKILWESDARSASSSERKKLREEFMSLKLTIWKFRCSETVRASCIFVKELLTEHIDQTEHRLRTFVSSDEIVPFFRSSNARVDGTDFVIPRLKIDVYFDQIDGRWLFLVAGRPVYECGGIEETGIPPVFQAKNFLNAFVALEFAVDVLSKLPSTLGSDEYSVATISQAIAVVDRSLEPTFQAVERSVTADAGAMASNETKVVSYKDLRQHFLDKQNYPKSIEYFRLLLETNEVQRVQEHPKHLFRLADVRDLLEANELVFTP